MNDLEQLQSEAAQSLACAMLAHAAPQSEQFRTKMLNNAVDRIAEYSCENLKLHYKLDARPNNR